MRNVISYVLFGTEGRYWVNIPYVLVSNSVIYPEFCMKFYVHRESTRVPSFKLLEKTRDLFPNVVEIDMIDKSYQGTELTNWRLKPLWDEEIEVLLCRDLDHITNEPERRAVEYFLRHNTTKCIHGIRSYSLHTVPFLAGLCGFRCSTVRKVIKRITPTFQDYLTWGKTNIKKCKQGWEWGCDQALLRDFFGNLDMYKEAMDCPQFTAPLKITGFDPLVVMPHRYKNILVENCNMEVLKLSDSFAPGFTGQPVDATTEQTKKLITVANNDMARAVSEYV